MESKIDIKLSLTDTDIEQLVFEHNSCNSSFLIEFIENILKNVDSVTCQLKDTADRIMNVNPYSKMHKEILDESI